MLKYFHEPTRWVSYQTLTQITIGFRLSNQWMACYAFEGIFTIIKFCFQSLEEEDKMTAEQLAIKNVGKQDPKRHLEEQIDVLMTNNITQCLGAMMHTVVFK